MKYYAIYSTHPSAWDPFTLLGTWVKKINAPSKYEAECEFECWAELAIGRTLYHLIAVEEESVYKQRDKKHRFKEYGQ